MFNNPEFNQTLSSKSVIVPSEHQKSYVGGGEPLRFVVPDYIRYIDMKQSFLSFKLKVKAPRPVRLNKTAGAHSIIDRIRIYDGSQTIQLENCENYAERVALTHHYSSNTSMNNKRGLLEAVESEIPTVSENTHSTSWGGSLVRNIFTEPIKSNLQAATTITAAQTMNGNTIEVALRLECGVFSHRSAFPNGHIGGLIIEIDTNPALKVLELVAPQGIAETDYPVAAPGPGPANATKQYFNVIEGGIAGVYSAAGLVNAACMGFKLASAGQLVNHEASLGLSTANNVKVGDVLRANAGPLGANVISLGAITEIKDLGAGVLALEFAAVDLSNAPEQMLVGAKVWVQVGGLNAPLVGTAGEISYTCDELQLVLKQVEVPKSYDDMMVRAKESQEGMSIDLWSYDTYRNNVQSGEVISQINIPSYNERVKSVLTLPYNNTLTHSLWENNLTTVLDGIQSYVWYLDGLPQPTKAVETDRMSLDPAQIDQVALWEQEKALSSCGIAVSKLTSQDKFWFIPRALARYNGVYDLKDKGSIQLKTTYSAPAVNKLLISFICHVRRVVVSSMGKYVEL